MDLSIVTISYNTKEMLKAMLDSIQRTVRKTKYEIIIVDNASTDGSAEMLRECFPEVILIANEDNRWVSKANNQGGAIARGESILFLNPDTVVNENAIDEMVVFLRKESTAGAVGCKLLNYDGSLQRSCGLFPNLLIELFTRTFLNRIFPKSPLFNMHKLASWDYSTSREVEWATTACLLVRKKIFDSLCGFDEDILMYYDDVEFCKRIRQNGWAIRFYPDVSVYHFHGGSWRSSREIPIKQNIINAIHYYRKHHSKAEQIVLHILLLLEIVLNFFVVIFFHIFREPKATIVSRLKGLSSGCKYLLLKKQ